MQVNCTYSVWAKRPKIFVCSAEEEDKDKFETVESRIPKHKEKQQCFLEGNTVLIGEHVPLQAFILHSFIPLNLTHMPHPICMKHQWMVW